MKQLNTGYSELETKKIKAKSSATRYESRDEP